MLEYRYLQVGSFALLDRIKLIINSIKLDILF